jgi:hypothetical protein
MVPTWVGFTQGLDSGLRDPAFLLVHQQSQTLQKAGCRYLSSWEDKIEEEKKKNQKVKESTEEGAKHKIKYNSIRNSGS